jgi:hypothetical protein
VSVGLGIRSIRNTNVPEQGLRVLHRMAPKKSIQTRVVVQQPHTEGSESRFTSAVHCIGIIFSPRNYTRTINVTQRNVTNCAQVGRLLSTSLHRVSAVHQRYMRKEQRQYRTRTSHYSTKYVASKAHVVGPQLGIL